MVLVVLSLTLSLIFLPALSYAEPLHFPLLRRAPVTSNMDYYNSVANHIRMKYGFTTPSKRATSANINLTNQVRFLVGCSPCSLPYICGLPGY